MKARTVVPFDAQYPDKDAAYLERRTIDLSAMVPLVALPDGVIRNTVPVNEARGQHIDQDPEPFAAFIKSETTKFPRLLQSMNRQSALRIFGRIAVDTAVVVRMVTQYAPTRVRQVRIVTAPDNAIRRGVDQRMRDER